MTTHAMLQALADPMGVPFYPRVFQTLGVLTFSIHILCVNLAIGALVLSIYGRYWGDDFWKGLSGSLAKACTAAVSGAILFGVAPLLFMQVLYDPFWYASNMLSGAWVLGFVGVVTAAYGILYLRVSRDCGASGVVSAALFLVAGAIMHALNAQMLAPEKWTDWAVKDGAPSVSGLALHAFEPLRFAHFIVPAVAAAGVFLLLYAWYFSPREDFDKTVLARAARAGASLAFWATAVQALGGVLWLVTLPSEFRFHMNPAFVVAALLGFGLLGYFWRIRGKEDPAASAPGAAAALFIVTLAMAASRETLRGLYLGKWGYTLAAHQVHLDIGSTALFFATFVLGVSVAAWLLAVAFQAGRVPGRWTPGPRMQAWGKASIGILAAWLVVVVALGIFITFKNHGA